MDIQVKKPQIVGRNPTQDLSFKDLSENSQQISEFSLNEDKIKNEFKILRYCTETDQHFKNLIGYDQQYKEKNRYSDMLPFIHTIVKTEAEQKQPTLQNYYNGNYVSTVFNEKDLIMALMGPLDTTLSVFWRMVWINNVQTIIMLCQLEDGRGVQCAHYWPSNGKEEKYGDYTVRFEGQNKKNYFKETNLSITNGNQTKNLQHLWWTGWPDYGVPEFNHIGEMEEIADIMIKNCNQNLRTMIHCSAGVGRTGTMISCFQIQRIMQYYKIQMQQLIQQGKTPEEVKKDKQFQLSVFSIARRQREDRLCLIQNKDQYLFVYHFARIQIQKLLGFL